MSRIIFFVSLVTFCISHAKEDLSVTIANLIKTNQSVEDSGIAVAVIQNDRIIFSSGYGYRDREQKTPVDADTQFAIASTTKAFTSTALKIAENRKLLLLESPVVEYFPEFKLIDATATSSSTLADFLSHRTGLPRHDALWYFDDFNRNLLPGRLACLPYAEGGGYRQGFLYNNLLYTLAGLALEKRAGESFEHFMQHNIFDVVGMPNTGFQNPDFEKNFAKPYLKEVQIPVRTVNHIAPAGGIVSNVKDLAAWVQTFLNKGRTAQGRQLLSENDIASLYSVYNKVNDSQNYGLGWFIETLEGFTLVHHSGNIDGYSAFVSFMPEKNIGVIVLENQNASPLPLKVATGVYSRLLNEGAHITDTAVHENLNLNISTAPPVVRIQAQTALSENEHYNHCSYGTIAFKNDTNNKKSLLYGKAEWPLRKVSFGYWAKATVQGKEILAPIVLTEDGSGFTIPLEAKTIPILFSR